MRAKWIQDTFCKLSICKTIQYLLIHKNSHSLKYNDNKHSLYETKVTPEKRNLWLGAKQLPWKLQKCASVTLHPGVQQVRQVWFNILRTVLRPNTDCQLLCNLPRINSSASTLCPEKVLSVNFYCPPLPSNCFKSQPLQMYVCLNC